MFGLICDKNPSSFLKKGEKMNKENLKRDLALVREKSPLVYSRARTSNSDTIEPFRRLIGSFGINTQKQKYKNKGYRQKH